MASSRKLAMARDYCPDCSSQLQPVKLIGRLLPQNGELKYEAAPAQAGTHPGRFPVSGNVRSLMCPSCGRIILHAEPPKLAPSHNHSRHQVISGEKERPPCSVIPAAIFSPRG